jgi:hypothetical protein
MLSAMFLFADYWYHFLVSIVAAMLCGFDGGGRCADPVICGGSTEPAIRLFTGGEAFDLVICTIFRVEARLACTLSAPDVYRSAMRTIIGGASFDLVLITMIWIVVVAVLRGVRLPQMAVTAAWVAGNMVGRGVGASIIASTDITGIFWNTICINLGIAFSTTLFNFRDIHWLLACFRHEVAVLLAFNRHIIFNRPIKDTEKQATKYSFGFVNINVLGSKHATTTP